MHENVDISRELQETKLLFTSVLLVEGRVGGGGGGSDSALADVAADIIGKVSYKERCFIDDKDNNCKIIWNMFYKMVYENM